MTSDTSPLSSIDQKNTLFSVISNEDQLRKTIPKPPKILEKRIQPSLDSYSCEFIEHATLAAIGTTTPGIALQLITLAADNFCIASNQRLIIRSLTQSAADTDKQQSSEGAGETSKHSASLYLLAPGVGHALRVNGLIQQTKDHQWSFHIQQVYFHCARAAARAQLWHADNNKAARANTKSCAQAEPTSLSNFVAKSSYLLLKTQNAKGGTDLSSRGDPAGFVIQLSRSQWLIPERPGNKVAVSLRNIIETGEIECLLMAPDSDQLLRVSGSAQVISSQQLLAPSAIKGKTPSLGILIDITHCALESQTLLKQLDLWNSEHHLNSSDITSFPKALAAHMNGNGILSKATGGLMKGVVNSVVKRDMKNLY